MTTNTATVQKFVTEGKVSMKNLVINPKNGSFTIDFAFIEGRQKKFNFQTISGNITPELYEWFTKVFVDRVEEGSAVAGEETTAFKKYLKRKDIEYKPGILKELSWECSNKSDQFDDCPFRLTISPKYDSATLNLVYKYAKVVKDKRFDPNTGKTVKIFGYKKFANMKREYFRRLEIFTEK